MKNYWRKLLGIDIEAENKKRQEEYLNYVHLLDTLNPAQIMEEIAHVFGGDLDVKRTAILAVMMAKILQLEGKLK